MTITHDMRAVASLAAAAERRKDMGLYRAFCNILGRMDRNPGSGKFDEDDEDHVAISRGMIRAEAICRPSTTDVDLFTPSPVHAATDC